MRISEKSAGLAIPTVLSVMVLMLIIIATVASQGIGALHSVGVTQTTKQSAYAAEAGVADGMRRLIENPDEESVFQEDFGDRYRYRVEITNNFATGGGEKTAPNGARVPPGYSYILATGSRRDGRYARQVGVLVTGGVGSSIQFAIGAGGGVDFGGSKRIAGGIKANGTINLTGNTSITPVDGNGRLISSSSITGGGNATMDSGQDARARQNVSLNLRGNPTVVEGDLSSATDPFINDYRYSNTLNSGESGLVLPNPDPMVLLQPVLDPAGPPAYPSVVTWPGGSGAPAGSFVDWTGYGSSFSGTLDLGDGQVHYFPDGISFPSNASIVGRGTIIVGNGNSVTFNGNTTGVTANVIALRRPDQYPSTGEAGIRFSGNSSIEGFLYAHGDITFQGNSDVKGMIIAYQGSVTGGGNSDVVYDPAVLLDLPGFEPWSAGIGGISGGGAGPVSVVLWERF